MPCFVSLLVVPRRMVPLTVLAAWSLMLACVVSLPGCGRGDVPELGTVTGVVTLDGQALPGAQVEFLPPSGRPSIAETGEDGSYRLQYAADHEGALVGSHTVKIRTAVEGRVDRQEELVPPRYHAQTELTAEVKPGRNRFDFDLTSK